MYRFIKPTVFLVTLAGLLSVIGCTGSPETEQNADSGKPIEVICTVGMVADVVKNVGGEHVNVTQLMGPGVDPHLYKTTRDDVRKIMQADMVFYSGLMLEGKMSDTLVKVARSKPVIAVTEEIEQERLLEPEDMAGHFDPHVWMDVAAWSTCVDVIADSLSDADPQHANEFKTNAEVYRKELENLHQYGLKSISTIPAEGRILITSHDAFNYFGRAYGLNVQGVQGLSTESEAGLQRINELVDMLVEKKIKAVFVESSVPRKNIDALVEGAQSKGHTVLVGGELFSDAMGAAETYEGTYIGMLDHNITLVTNALGGDAPAAGLNEKLSH